VQPTPQALPQKHPGGSTILVSPRQRGNPVLTSVRSMPWEYSDIPADFVLGTTTCALFLRFDMPPSIPHNKKQFH
jgi:DNA excision repair protein ERCC-1